MIFAGGPRGDHTCRPTGGARTSRAVQDRVTSPPTRQVAGSTPARPARRVGSSADRAGNVLDPILSPACLSAPVVDPGSTPGGALAGRCWAGFLQLSLKTHPTRRFLRPATMRTLRGGEVLHGQAGI